VLSLRAPETNLSRLQLGLLLGALVLLAGAFGAATPEGAGLSLFAAVVIGLAGLAVFSAWHGCLGSLAAIALLPQPFSFGVGGATLTVGRFVLFVTLLGWFMQRRRADFAARSLATPLDPMLLAVLAALLLSTIANLPRLSAVDVAGAVRKIAVFGIDFVVLYRVVGAVLVDRDRALKFLRFFTGLITVTAVLGLFERFSGRNVFELLAPVLPSRVNTLISQLASASTLERGSISRLHSTFEQPLIFALVLLLGIPLASAFLLAATRTSTRVVWGLSTAAMGTALLFTASRGAYLVLATMFLTTLIAAPDRRARLAVFAAALVLVGGGLTSQDVRTTMVSYLSTTQRAGQLEGSLQSRVDAFGTTADLLSNKPFFGYGPGSFASAPESASRVINRVLDNAYLEHAAETGVVGTASLAGLLFAAFVMAVRYRRHATSREDALLGVGLITAVQAWVLFGFFADEYLFNSAPRLFFALLAAIAALRAAQTAAASSAAGQADELPRQRRDEIRLVKAASHDVATGATHGGSGLGGL